MAYFSTAPAPGHRTPTGKNRVWDFFPLSNKQYPANRRQPAQPRRKIRPTPTKSASGIPYWPSRDPIQEDGGENLYGMMANRSQGWIDFLGLKLQVVTQEGKIGRRQRKEIESMLRTICKETEVDRAGNVRVPDALGAKYSNGCCCLKKLADSKNNWSIEGRIMNAESGGKPTTWDNNTGNSSPVYLPEGQVGPPAPGSGTGGGVIVPLPGGNIDQGFIDPQGKPHIAPLWRVLAHELCGHAVFMDNGTEDIGPQAQTGIAVDPESGRPEHDQAIRAENSIAGEHPGEPLRGEYNDKPNQGITGHDHPGGGESFVWPKGRPLPQ